MIFRQRVNAFPMEQVCTFEQEHLTALSGHIVCNQGAEGTIGSLPDLGVTEGKTASAFGKFLPGDNGVVFVFGIVNAVAESKVLCLNLADFTGGGNFPCNARIHEQLTPVGKGHGGTGKTSVTVKGTIRSHSGGEILPVKQIITDGVSPVHGSPMGIVRVILIKQMVTSLIP